MSWQEVLSNEVLDIRDGTHDSPKYLDSGYPLITSKNLKQGIIDFSDVSLISEEDYNNINKRSRVNKGDILYSMIGSIGNYALANKEPHYAIKNVALFKFIDKRLYNKYFLHLINSFVIERQIKKAMKGGTQKFVSLKILRNLKIPLPPLDQQKKIAAILDAADDYRQKTKALITKYDELTQSLFLDMFGDPRLNEQNFEQNNLNEYLELITYGLTVRPKYIDNGIRLISAREIRSGILDLTSGPQISESDYNKLSAKGKPNRNEILFSKTGSIGHSAIIDTDVKFAITQNAARLVFKVNVNPVFALEQLRTSYFQSLCQQRAKGNAVKDLQLGDMKKLPFISPPIKLQNQFAERVQAIEAQKAQAQASLAQAEDLFNSLLQRAFKGELS